MMFAVILQHPSGGGKLGAKNEATVTVFAAEGKPMILVALETKLQTKSLSFAFIFFTL